MTAYYNENEPYCAAWLRNLIAANLIAPGNVDERDIRDVIPTDLAPYAQCHFFAGIGGWSRALRLAAWPDHRPVWTGSCPCQPFSQAGKRRGFADERHLWPHWFHLISQCRPAIIFGEQVAKATDWLGLVRGDLEALDYAVGAMPIEAASAGADQLRDRYWFVASDGSRRRSHDSGIPLSQQVAMYPTPSSSGFEARDPQRLLERRQECKERTNNGNGFGLTLGQFALLNTNGSLAPTEKRGALNPELVCWLMMYPPEWLNCAPSATRSSRKSPRNS